MNIPIYQVDAFANRVFSGNPAAVCPLDDWLPDETMQRIAAENNLAETAFFVGRNGHYELRWFTPVVEVPLCGHATLAAAHVISYELAADGKPIEFASLRSGRLRVEKQDDLLVLDFPRHTFEEIAVPAGLAEAIGKSPRQVWAAEGGIAMVMLLFDDEEEIRSIAPDFAALEKLPFDSFVVTSPGTQSDFVSRFFAPRFGIPEDPVTGGAHCALIPFWAERLGKQKLHARQLSARGGELFCELNGDRVRIGGHARLYMRGEIFV